MGRVAIIGGSGINESSLFKGLELKSIDTKFCRDGSGLVEYVERTDGTVFIKRHGYCEHHGPSCSQYAANIIAAAKLGCEVIIATSAVGSLNKKIKPGSVVIVSDYVDESLRKDNLYGQGITVHLNPRPPFSPQVRSILLSSAKSIEDHVEAVVNGGVYVCIPGDRFGTAAEGRKRAKYADIVGMTVCPEACMAQQLGIHYAAVACVVDADADANHSGKTVAMMKAFSDPKVLPEMLEIAVKKAKRLAANPPLFHKRVLHGNIISGSLDRISNDILSERAELIIKRYAA